MSKLILRQAAKRARMATTMEASLRVVRNPLLKELTDVVASLQLSHKGNQLRKQANRSSRVIPDTTPNGE